MSVVVAVIGFILTGIVLFSVVIYRRTVWNDFLLDFAGSVYESESVRAERPEDDVKLSAHNSSSLYSMLTNSGFAFDLTRPSNVTESIFVYYDNGSKLEICDTEEGYVWLEYYFAAEAKEYKFLLGKDVKYSNIKIITSVSGGAVTNEPWSEAE